MTGEPKTKLTYRQLQEMTGDDNQALDILGKLTVVKQLEAGEERFENADQRLADLKVKLSEIGIDTNKFA